MTHLGDRDTATTQTGRRVLLRRLWLSVHRWIGLTIGLLFVLLGLSGSLLVFDHAIDEWLNPDLLLTQGTGTRLPLQQVIDAAEQAYGDGSAEAAAVSTPRVDNGVWTVWFEAGSREEPKFAQVFVDPCSGQVTGQRIWGEYLMTWVYRLHFRLLAGPSGGVFVGLSGLVLMLSILSGVWLWWPLWKNGWRAAFAIRGGRRFSYDLHKTLGVVSATFLLVIAFTGVYMAFPDWFEPLVTSFSDKTPQLEGLTTEPDATGTRLTPEEAIAIGAELFPEATFDHFHPANGDGVYEVAFRQPGEVQQSFGRTQVFIEPYTGEVLAVRDPRKFTVADHFIAWQFPLHNGEAFGLVGRWIVFFLGLTPAVLYVTGCTVWWRRPKMRVREAAQLAESTAYSKVEPVLSGT